ncbi:MAG: PAS domain S-box protein [Rhizonema sp. PD37]|nr:PAS domain S-box protein [Rhizonema sp. PD37]
MNTTPPECTGNILIIDDLPENLKLLDEILSDAGYQVNLAPSGKLALSFLQSTLPDLILLDIMMPEMDGYEMCSQLKISERTQDIPVIFISSLHEVPNMVKAFSVGGVDYITRPFNVPEVLARVQNQLRLSHISKQLVEKNAQLSLEIEERKRVEKVLQDKKHQLLLLADALPSCVAYVDTNQHYRFVNKSYETWFGISRKEICGTHIQDIIGINAYRIVQANIEQVLAGRYVRYEAEMPYAIGKTRYITETLVPNVEKDGQIDGYYSMITDISERKHAEEVIIQQKELLQSIFDHIPVMVILFDSNGRIQFVNRETERLLGWSQAELENVDLLAEWCPDLECRASILEHMVAITGKWQDIKLRTRFGHNMDTAWANIRLSSDMNIGIGQDITERKQTEEASVLEERNRMAREIHDTLAQAFTGIILHVGAATRVLTKDLEAVRTHLETVEDLAQSGLAEARRSVAALRPQLLEDGNLSSAINHLVTQMKTSTHQTDLTYEIVGTVYPLPSDVENHLLRIGQEALTNAVKHAFASEICIELVYKDTHCLLQITDNGQGFKVDNLALKGGFGLLGMTERSERIGARLMIQSQLGQGTEIVVTVNR